MNDATMITTAERQARNARCREEAEAIFALLDTNEQAKKIIRELDAQNERDAA